MSERIPCEFSLIRYVPDVVKGEFTNIGVVLREVSRASQQTPEAARKAVTQVRFTRDWRRVRCIDPDADTDLLETLEDEIASLLISEATGPLPARPLLSLLSDTLSNSIQITEPRPCLAETFALELDQLLRLYIEPIRIKLSRKRTGRAAIYAEMRKEFERTGAWAAMQKRIPASQYTRPGDPMKLDCGYRPNRVVHIFHAVSLESDAEAAKSLAFTAPLLRTGIFREDKALLNLTAVVEPIRAVSEEGFTDEAADLYRFGVASMESADIRVLTTSDLSPRCRDRPH